MKKVLLIYPPLGFYSDFILHPPLSLIYLAIECVKNGVYVEILDMRLFPEWRDELDKRLAANKFDLIGVSIMTGLPVKNAAEISEYIVGKSDAKILWGGAHPTILPEQVMALDYVDFVIRGFGSKALNQLCNALDGEDYENVEGLCYKKDSEVIIGSINKEFEIYSYKDIPYHLIDDVVEQYLESYGERVMPIFTAAGCPYNCAFCICPIWYDGLSKKWIPYEVQDIIEHIKFLREKYNVSLVYLYDDDSFVDKKHGMAIAESVLKENIKVKIGVRGFRINELDRMTSDDYQVLIKAGIRYLHVGVESGSDRMLGYMKKGTSKEQIIRVNKNLAKHPELVPMYNMLSGFPGETIEDLKESKEMMLRLVKDNKQSILLGPGKYIPYPGSYLYDDAISNGFTPPEDPKQWAFLDQEADIWMPWYTKEFNDYIDMLQLSSFTIDNRKELLKDYPTAVRGLYSVLRFFYKPVILTRLHMNFEKLLIEKKLIKLAQILVKLLNRSGD